MAKREKEDAAGAKGGKAGKAGKGAKVGKPKGGKAASGKGPDGKPRKDSPAKAGKKGKAAAPMKAPPASSEAVRKSMQGNKRRDTKPELAVRKMLREMGYPGYRLDWKKAPGHPDIAYPGRKTCVFVMGCFWHDHEGCKYASKPSTHSDYWEEKFRRNKERDARVRAELEEMGWNVIDIWECELKRDRIEETRTRLEQQIHYAFVKL